RNHVRYDFRNDRADLDADVRARRLRPDGARDDLLGCRIPRWPLVLLGRPDRTIFSANEHFGVMFRPVSPPLIDELPRYDSSVRRSRGLNAGMTDEGLKKLLSAFSEDPERAAELYLHMQGKLI